MGVRHVGTNPRHQFTHVIRRAVIAGNHTRQFIGIIERLAVAATRGGDAALVPLQAMHKLAAHLYRLPVVFCQVLCQSGNTGVHFGAAQFFFSGDFPGGGLEQWWPGEEGAAIVFNRNDIVAEAGHIGAAGSG